MCWHALHRPRRMVRRFTGWQQHRRHRSCCWDRDCRSLSSFIFFSFSSSSLTVVIVAVHNRQEAAERSRLLVPSVNFGLSQPGRWEVSCTEQRELGLALLQAIPTATKPKKFFRSSDLGLPCFATFIPHTVVLCRPTRFPLGGESTEQVVARDVELVWISHAVLCQAERLAACPGRHAAWCV